jgi:hypothetical protein
MGVFCITGLNAAIVFRTQRCAGYARIEKIIPLIYIDFSSLLALIGVILCGTIMEFRHKL